MNLNLQNARVMVVDESGGIGAATADALQATGAQLERSGRDVLDITDNASVDAYFAKAEPIDHVVVAMKVHLKVQSHHRERSAYLYYASSLTATLGLLKRQ